MQLAHLMVGLNYPILLSAHFLLRFTNDETIQICNLSSALASLLNIFPGIDDILCSPVD